MKKIAIVTLCYNKGEMTHSFLQEAKKIDKKNLKVTIVVVDNASRETFGLTKEEEQQGVVVIRNKENLGFTGGCNTGIEFAIKNDYDYVMLLNNDTMPDKDLATELVKAAERIPKAGILGAKIYFAPGYEFHKDRYKKEERGKVFWYAGGTTDWANVYSVHRGVDEVDRGQYDKEEEVEFISGCCMMIPVEVIKKVGMFDNKYFLYCEDGDLNERVRRAGYKTIYVPKAKLWHIAGGSTGGIGSNLQDYFLSRNRMLFGMRYAPLRAKFALIRESLRFLLSGREWQKNGIRDFYLGRFGKGSYPLSKPL